MKNFSEFRKELGEARIARGYRSGGMPTGDDRASDDKPLLIWLDKLERELKKFRKTYANVDSVDAVKLYNRGVIPRQAAKDLLSGKEIKEETLHWEKMGDDEKQEIVKGAGLPKRMSNDAWKELDRRAKEKLGKYINKTTGGEFNLKENVDEARSRSGRGVPAPLPKATNFAIRMPIKDKKHDTELAKIVGAETDSKGMVQSGQKQGDTYVFYFKNARDRTRFRDKYLRNEDAPPVNTGGVSGLTPDTVGVRKKKKRRRHNDTHNPVLFDMARRNESVELDEAMDHNKRHKEALKLIKMIGGNNWIDSFGDMVKSRPNPSIDPNDSKPVDYMQDRGRGEWDFAIRADGSVEYNHLGRSGKSNSIAGFKKHVSIFKESVELDEVTRIAVDKEFNKVTRSGKMDTMAATRHIEKKFGIKDVKIQKDRNGKTHVTSFLEEGRLEKSLRMIRNGDEAPAFHKEYCGHPVFKVSEQEFGNCKSRRRKGDKWGKYFDGESPNLESIRKYSLKNPNRPLVIQNEVTGQMSIFRRRLNDGRLKHNKKNKKMMGGY